MRVNQLLSIVPNDKLITILNREGLCVERGIPDSIVNYLESTVILASFYDDSITLWIH